MWPTLIGFGVLGGLLWNRRNELPETQVPDVKSVVQSYFSSPHDMYPNGAYDLKIDGAGFSTIHAQGNPEPRNPLNELILYVDNQKQSTLINKNNARWEQIGVLNKENQMAFIDDKISKFDAELMTPKYKQLSGRTRSHKPKINLKNTF